MNESQIRQLLRQVRAGDLSVDEASSRLRSLPFEDLGFARVDHHRAMRCGFPEVIFCTGKTDGQVAGIAERIVASGSDLLATRATPAMYDAVAARCPGAEYDETARTIVVQESWRDLGIGEVLVVSAGTSDIPVAEEAAVTARVLGNRVERLYDVGVAGIHRLLSHHEAIMNASVLVVAAGIGGRPGQRGRRKWVSQTVIACDQRRIWRRFKRAAAPWLMLNELRFGVTV